MLLRNLNCEKILFMTNRHLNSINVERVSQKEFLQAGLWRIPIKKVLTHCGFPIILSLIRLWNLNIHIMLGEGNMCQALYSPRENLDMYV